MKKIMLIMLLITIGFLSCKTQAIKEKDEPMSCYQARYMAREGMDTAATIMAEECPKEIKRDWCLRVLQERPGIFKDFNDCWRQ